MKSETDQDVQMRMAAFEQVRRLSDEQGYLTAEDLKPGFRFEGERVPIHHPQQGIHKPRTMSHLLAIKTFIPSREEKIRYDDQREVHNQIFQGEETVEYAFMGDNPKAAQNLWLREAYEHGVPVIYFMGFSHRRYIALFPAFIVGWNANSLKAHVAFGSSDRDAYGGLGRYAFGAPGSDAYDLPDSGERRNAFRAARRRLHKAIFQETVIAAYGGRCALSGLSDRRLLDAARIAAEPNERPGELDVPNGLSLSKIHRAALGANLIGIDADYRVHVAKNLRDQEVGPELGAYKHLHGGTLLLPKRAEDRPDRDLLAKRFEQFDAAA